MDKHEADGFYVPEDPSEARTQRVATWVSVSVAVFTPTFASAVAFGWMPVRLSLEIVLCAAALILVVAGVLAAANIRRSFLRANGGASRKTLL